MFMGKGNFKLGSDVKPHTMVAAGREGCAAGMHLWAAEGTSEAAVQPVPVGMLLCPPHATGHAHVASDTSVGTLNSGMCCRGRNWIGISFIVGRWPL